MTAFRNLLITAGAALGAGFVVNALRWWLLYPLTGLSVAKGSPVSAVAWASGLGTLAALLAGVGAGISVQTNQPTRWSFLLAVLVALGSGTNITRSAFADIVTHATAEFAVSATNAVVAFVVFHLAHARAVRRSALANAR